MLPRRWRPVFSDGFSISFLLVSVISEFLFELFVVLPVTEEGLLPLYLHVILGTFIFINILANFAMIMVKDSTIRKIILPSLLKPLWHFCAACETNAPPRSYHCEKCRICVLKRDHHCTFAGSCIGLKNYRYYMLFLLYLSIGSAYASLFNMYFIWDVLGGISVFSVAAHIVPFVFWLFGYLSFNTFFCTMMSVLGVVGVLFVTNLFIFHLKQMLRNQTTFEKNQGIFDYDLGWKKNLVESLGYNWHIAWLFPLFESPLPSDGLSFTTKEDLKPFSSSQNTIGNLRHRHL